MDYMGLVGRTRRSCRSLGRGSWRGRRWIQCQFRNKRLGGRATTSSDTAFTQYQRNVTKLGSIICIITSFKPSDWSAKLCKPLYAVRIFNVPLLSAEPAEI